MKKIKMLRQYAGPLGAFKDGKNYEIESRVADALLECEAAELVDPPAPPKKPKAKTKTKASK